MVGVAVAIVAGSVGTSLVSHAFGFGDVGLILLLETIVVFGAAFSYAVSYWPKWFENRALRARILVTLVMLFIGHTAVAALTVRQLRAEWGGPVWMAIGIGEIVGITAILGLVTRDAQ